MVSVPYLTYLTTLVHSQYSIDDLFNRVLRKSRTTKVVHSGSQRATKNVAFGSSTRGLLCQLSTQVVKPDDEQSASATAKCCDKWLACLVVKKVHACASMLASSLYLVYRYGIVLISWSSGTQYNELLSFRYPTQELLLLVDT